VSDPERLAKLEAVLEAAEAACRARYDTDTCEDRLDAARRDIAAFNALSAAVRKALEAKP
jgi:hypothetical protein